MCKARSVLIYALIVISKGLVGMSKGFMEANRSDQLSHFFLHLCAIDALLIARYELKLRQFVCAFLVAPENEIIVQVLRIFQLGEGTRRCPKFFFSV